MRKPSPNPNVFDACSQTPPAMRRDPTPREEFAAARARMGERSIPQLIELLLSRDLRTRFLAEMSLRDATGT